ncbi:MAG: PCP reductase family protein [Nitrospirae bacterium]|nr:PCP reductase family protein [Nitrospirota bacterium]
MKFVCLNCETYMNFDKVEKPAENSLGVFFTCPSCDAKFSMVTNPGETQMVNSLGVQLGGRTAPATPMEFTRNTISDEVGTGAGNMAAYLNEKIQGGQPATAATPGATSESGEGGGCPFSAMVAQMGLNSGAQTTGTQTTGTTGTEPDLTWTPDAQEKLGRLPSFVQPMVKGSVESYARKNGFLKVTLQVMDDSKNASSDGIAWSPEAEERLKNIPDFIQPMARKEIERLAKERGTATITAELMDEAKDKFMKFM